MKTALAGTVTRRGGLAVTLPRTAVAIGGSQGTIPFNFGGYGVLSPASPIAVNVTAATAAGDSLVVAIAMGGTAPLPVTGVTDTQGNTYTAAFTYTAVAPYLFVYEAPGATRALTLTGNGGGPDQVIITYAAGTINAVVEVSLSDCPGEGTADVSTGTTGTSTTPSVTGTPAVSGELALAVFTWPNAGGAGTMGASFTQLDQQHVTSLAYLTVGYNVNPAAGAALTASETIVSNLWRAALVTFEAGGPPGSGPFTPAVPALATSLAGTVTRLGGLAVALPGPGVVPDDNISDENGLLEAGSAAATTTTAALAFTIPSGTQVGDIIGVWCATGATGVTWTAPPGPAWIAKPAASGAGGSCQLFTRAYDGTEGWTPGLTTVTFTRS